MTGTTGGPGEERLVRPEDLAAFTKDARSADARSDDAPGSVWPVVTIAFATAASWMAVVLTFARIGFDPDLLAFHTENVPWVLVTVGTPATLTIAAGAAGMHPSHRFAAALRGTAAVIAGAQLVTLAVIAVIQGARGARAVVVTETVLTSVTVLLAAGAIVLGFLGARERSRAALGGRFTVAGLAAVTAGQVVLAAATVARQPDVEFYVISLAISALAPLVSLTALWLVSRTSTGLVRIGAATLVVLGVVAVGSLANVFMVGLPGSSVPLQSVQVALYAGAAVAAALAARDAAGRA
ncbi:hypothetical protein [Myceligenerans crystallogenes]|uniref:Uncharacterized protein n=1 Tax=Myceligenerans crystallogenes TaxID=316335 RepID=A0ABP4ZSP7_9MICO